MPEAIKFIDRETGTVCEETIYGRSALEFGYQTGVGRALLTVLPHRAASCLYGWSQRLPSSRNKIRGFIDSLGIEAADAELPIDDYGTLDEFFCRRLKPDARPISTDLKRLVSPADGRTLVYPKLRDPWFEIKGARVHLAELLDDSAEAESYADGAAIVVRLAPCDYHRFHFPDSGYASPARRVKGRLHSVHPIALANNAPSFRNLRDICQLTSDNYGRVVLIEVGAFAVGTIVQTYAPGAVRKGQEKGYFRFGGSTVVMLVPPNRLTLDEDLVEASTTGTETFVKMGTGIGTAVAE